MFSRALMRPEGEGRLTVDKGDDFSGSSTDLSQGAGGVVERGTGGRRDARETLRRLGGSRRSSLASLGSRLGGGGGVPDSGPPDHELRLPKHGTGRRGGHLEDHWKRKGF